ncbi:MAG: hypothetical protein GF364_03720, partial [Candidatus Lokiarchaeota archaeon]|nr:hypothetical protein [Candidatus Lokiarchaeota archaeon]
MPIETAINNIESAINLIEKELKNTNEFLIFSYVKGSSDKTGECCVIVNKDADPSKKKMKKKDVIKMFDSAISKCEVLDLSDRKFESLIAFVLNQKNAQVKNREQTLNYLKKQQAALTLNSWIAGKLKYQFNKVNKDRLDIKIFREDSCFAIRLNAVDLREDGIVVLVEEDLNKIMEEKSKLRHPKEKEKEGESDTSEDEGEKGQKQESESDEEGAAEESDGKEKDVKQKESDKVKEKSESKTESDSVEAEEDKIERLLKDDDKHKPKAGGLFGPTLESVPELKKNNKELKVTLYDAQQKIKQLKEQKEGNKKEIEQLNNQLDNLKAQVIEFEMNAKKLEEQ